MLRATEGMPLRLAVPEEGGELFSTSARVLSEEIMKRTGLRTEEGAGGIRLCLDRELPEEAYRFSSRGGELVLSAGDGRGALYGVGCLLRKAVWREGSLTLSVPEGKTMRPVSSLRGHQMGYRPKTNAYDAWTPEIYDQYLRELALFGCNAAEFMPPRTDDDPTGPLMRFDPLDMLAIQSEKAHAYGMDVWLWYPNMGPVSSAEERRRELEERETVFSRMPFLDHVFIPGGDPGELDPPELFEWAGKVAEVLHRVHPHAGIWLSPQTFTPSREWTDAFYREAEREPQWLTGVVFGPWEKDPPEVLRARIPARLPLRNYPDIGHSLRCEYPLEKLDLAFALTLGREGINPRPYDEKHIQNTSRASFIGSLCYSEGINDDVNKFVWLGQEWDPESDVMDTLRDYVRLFIDPDQADALAQGFADLEDNLRGPLMVNDGIPGTLAKFTAMEKRLCPFGRNNYRFEMGMLRAVHDAYQQERLVYETFLQSQARHALEEAETAGVAAAVERALAILDRARTEPCAPRLRRRMDELADLLFEHIGMQLTESRHHALHWGRGGFLECADIPLNDARRWRRVLPEIASARMPSEILASANPSAPGDRVEGGVDANGDEGYRLRLLEAFLHRQDPGPGGQYADLGSWTGWRVIANPADYRTDPGFLHGALSSFVLNPPDEAKDAYALPLAWQRHGCAMYTQPLVLRFRGLNPGARYTLRCTYLGFFGQHARLTCGDGSVLHDMISTDRKIVTLDMEVPGGAYGSGELELVFEGKDGERGISVAEVWLLREKDSL